MSFRGTSKCQCVEQNLKSLAKGCSVTGTQKLCLAKLLTAVLHVIIYSHSRELEELIFEVAPGEIPLALNSILKGFIGCKMRTLFNLWKWICTFSMLGEK